MHPVVASEAIEGLAMGESFVCHKTIEYTQPNYTDPEPITSEHEHCAGAMIMLARANMPNLAMLEAIGEGRLDLDNLDISANVIETPGDFYKMHYIEEGLVALLKALRVKERSERNGH
jgi:hypothetical protein